MIVFARPAIYFVFCCSSFREQSCYAIQHLFCTASRRLRRPLRCQGSVWWWSLTSNPLHETFWNQQCSFENTRSDHRRESTDLNRVCLGPLERHCVRVVLHCPRDVWCMVSSPQTPFLATFCGGLTFFPTSPFSRLRVTDALARRCNATPHGVWSYRPRQTQSTPATTTDGERRSSVRPQPKAGRDDERVSWSTHKHPAPCSMQDTRWCNIRSPQQDPTSKPTPNLGRVCVYANL